MKSTDLLLQDLTYFLDDIFAEVNHGNNEVALDLIKNVQNAIEIVQTERAALEAQMADFYDSSSVLDDEEML